ncbi:phosphomannomutase [Saliphagus sp. LR7]|uniref:phosphomannomutase n=1 Tax=Saliphagus sp. LR7 TaxID=2282654 RepID=UPI000DF7710A|nr:phosphomannomutase [Saliphagus sp. LR7]
MTRFGTAGIRGPAEETVTPELALAVGQAAGAPGETVVLGRDGRETGPALAAAMEAGLESAGSDVRRLGTLPTPALAFASRGRRGVMLTASHNPPADNGIKLFEDGVEYDRAAEERIESRLESGPGTATWDEWGRGERVEILPDYRRGVADYVHDRFGEDPLEGLSVAVDCGNGVGALATPQVLDRLGAEVTALNATVDGSFPARESKPTREALSDFRGFLADGDRDLGLAHDGDADRLVVCDPDGEVVAEDTVLAVLAHHYVRRSAAADPVVVTTPNTSKRIDERVAEAGGRVERVRLGALHEGIAESEATPVFAGEPWKHVHLPFGGWIDAVVGAGVVSALAADAGGVDALRAPVTERPIRKESVRCPDPAKGPVMARLAEDLLDAFPGATVETGYGIRLEFPDDAWLLVRTSGTEPVVRLYAESESIEELLADAREVVERVVEDAG